jgi:hypothetical protein
MKHPQLSSQILEIVATKDINKTALKVFIYWLAQAPDFHPSNKVIEQRIGIDRAHVSRAWKELVKKQIVVQSGFSPTVKGIRSIIQYSMAPHILFKAEKLKVARMRNRLTVIEGGE